jgi:hypothetical protein
MSPARFGAISPTELDIAGGPNPTNFVPPPGSPAEKAAEVLRRMYSPPDQDAPDLEQITAAAVRSYP